MTFEGWKQAIKDAWREKSEEQVYLLAKIIWEAEEAKQILRRKGYGHTGKSLLRTVEEEIPESEDCSWQKDFY